MSQGKIVKVSGPLVVASGMMLEEAIEKKRIKDEEAIARYTSEQNAQ